MLFSIYILHMICSLTILDILSSKPFCTAPLHLLIASFTSLGSWGSELPPPPNTPIIWCVWVDCFFFCVVWNAFEGRNTTHIIISKLHILCVPPPNSVAIDLLQSLCLPMSPSLMICNAFCHFSSIKRYQCHGIFEFMLLMYVEYHLW